MNTKPLKSRWIGRFAGEKVFNIKIESLHMKLSQSMQPFWQFSLQGQSDSQSMLSLYSDFSNQYRLQMPNFIFHANWKVQDLSIRLHIQSHHSNINQHMLQSFGYIELHRNFSMTSLSRPTYRVILINNSHNRR